MIKTFSLGLDLLKVWFKLRLESSNCQKLLFNFYKARSIKNYIRSIESCKLTKISKRKKATTYLFEAQIAIYFFQYLKDIIS